ncbi:Aminopeptidase 2 [Paraliobacillus sp. PM-2]|uniref:aminopeptidase n=1 Tax=Paraliobacillus sp. PM-2 TaxID=1462524 RepID=UPI00061C55B6|nr:aminopeptidase [Paraliobacillus sp. PM-2]CQR46116.1 Aminopeptidase 2 [Paraliobacillus sp. PM-2]
MSQTLNMEKYARLILETGVNLQLKQGLIINAPIEAAPFVRLLVKKAYDLGAKNVHIEWNDGELTYLKMKHAPMHVLETFPKWKADGLLEMVRDGYSLLTIYGPDPDLLNGIDAERITAVNKASAQALTTYRDYVMNDRVTWSVVGYPTKAWAKKVFPDLSVVEAQEKLWDQIFSITRVDQDDPLQAWQQHNQLLEKAREYLNKKQYCKLIYKAEGTDLIIELPDGHIWHGGSGRSENGIPFNANIPTEEVFTMPHKYGVHGTVRSTKPLSYGGNIIDDFSLTFKEGKVVNFTAGKGEEALKHLLETDQGGAKRLGEVALVPHQSPISQSGLIFYNTLFDENASCHLALGKAYPNTIKNGSAMTEEEMDQFGVNNSLIHEDFMIGSAHMDIDGVTSDGETEPIFRKGNWAIDFNNLK